MKTKRTRKKVFALVLCISMTLCLIPAGANAADDTAGQATEVVSLREENVKHFDMGNGTYQAVAYSHPVHELDSEGNWQDIDFSMNLTQAKGVAAYINSAGTAFAANYTANQPLMTLTGDGTSIAMTLVPNTNTATMSTQEMASTATVAAELTATQTQIQTFEDAQAASFSNTLLYENVMPGIDLEYIVDPWTVKENIIVNQPASKYEYRFKLELTGFYPVLQEDGSVLIYNNATEAAEYEIPAPYMYDATGEMSFDVSYRLSGSNGIYYLIVAADSNWINADEREFPVVIDPSVTVHQDINMDTYINQDTPNEARGGYKFFFVGENEVAYIYTPTPTLPDFATFEEAELLLYYFYKDFIQSGYVDFSAHRVTDFYWAEESLKWTDVVGADYETYDNYRFGLSSDTLGTARASGTLSATSSTPKPLTVNVTDAVASWCNDGIVNKGIGLRYVTSSPNKSVMFRSTEGHAAYRPKLVYTYRLTQIALIGVTSTKDNHDHYSALNASAVKLRAVGYSDVEVKTQAEFDPAIIKNDMKTYNIIATRSHGRSINAVTSQGEQLGTAIMLNDAFGTAEQTLFGSCDLPTGVSCKDIAYITAIDSFDNVDLVLFIGCETGLGGREGPNLPTAIVEAGARVAIGFEKEILCEDANVWTETFLPRFVQEALLKKRQCKHLGYLKRAQAWKV